MMDLLKDLYSWVSLQPTFVRFGMMILLTAAGLYVLGYVMSIFFWFFLRATEDPSTRRKITTEERLAAHSGRGKERA
ncbi:MAG: hypothetical protein PVH99_15900 [Desulfobacteraceae bacterium]|jgi:hypothetical protein